MTLTQVLQAYSVVTYARASWAGKLVVKTGNGSRWLEIGTGLNQLSIPYTHSAEDALADDWEILRGRL